MINFNQIRMKINRYQCIGDANVTEVTRYVFHSLKSQQWKYFQQQIQTTYNTNLNNNKFEVRT